MADSHPLHSCSLRNFPEGAHIKEEEEPGMWVRHSCLPACDRRQFPGSGQEEGDHCRRLGVRWPKRVGTGQGGGNF